MRWIATALLFLLVCSEAAAERYGSGNDILASCRAFANGTPTSSADFPQGFCAGVVDTLLSAGPTMQSNLRFCPPEGVTTGQAIRVAVKYMERYPERLHFAFMVIAMDAFRTVWPCKK